uniref:DNL-type domain-containing protein n=1 Tax=Cyclophora tenuis TaxID=216820 RepID=A0A7S1D0K7_CYCTE|mmetsp:Transcript_15510/g.26270  ORF Transcript_15510/g.26270 Transcript_15510/m.26270 type:complete len:247 (+) Transcript_15510:52-792(+)
MFRSWKTTVPRLLSPQFSPCQLQRGLHRCIACGVHRPLVADKALQWRIQPGSIVIVRDFSSPVRGLSDDETDSDGKQERIEEEEASESISQQDMQLAMQAVLEDRNLPDSSNDADSSPIAETERKPKKKLVTPTIPGTQKGGKKLAVIYTCKVCDTRSAKQFSEQAYRHGVVLVRCPGCDNLHLIADRLGFFEDESWDVENALAKAGETVKTVTHDNVLEVTLRDVIGNDKVDEIVNDDIEAPLIK